MAKAWRGSPLPHVARRIGFDLPLEKLLRAFAVPEDFAAQPGGVIEGIVGQHAAGMGLRDLQVAFYGTLRILAVGGIAREAVQRPGRTEEGRRAVVPAFFRLIDTQKGGGQLFPRLALLPLRRDALKAAHRFLGFSVGSGVGAGKKRHAQEEAAQDQPHAACKKALAMAGGGRALRHVHRKAAKGWGPAGRWCRIRVATGPGKNKEGGMGKGSGHSSAQGAR